MRRVLRVLLLGLSLAGCASLPTGPGCVRIGPLGAACLLPPAALPALRAQHLISIEHDGRKDTFVGNLQINDQALRLAAASLFGTPLFTLTWDGQAVRMQPARAGLRPDLMLAVLQATVADPARLRPRLHGIELVVAPSADGGQVRTLIEHGHPVARIERQGGPLAAARVTITIAPAHLRLQLRPLPATGSESP